MTDTTVPIPAPSSDGAWPSVLADYREACATLQREVNRAREQGADISPDVAASHGWAARALIETPATYAIQIGQKIRAADNLVNLSQLYPGLAAILLRDIFGLLGIESGDCRVLPPSLSAT